MSQFDFPLSVKQGTELVLVVTTNVDLTGCTATMKIRPTTSTSATPILSLSTAGGIALGTGPSSTVTVTISSVSALSMPAGNYVYDLVIYDSLGEGIDFMEGPFEVKFQVSQ